MKTKFKVGDRPQWTPELISELPHGTVLECAYDSEDRIVYNGQNLVKHHVQLKCYKKDGIAFWFHDVGSELKYAKIISLPNSVEQKDTITAQLKLLHEWQRLMNPLFSSVKRTTDNLPMKSEMKKLKEFINEMEKGK